MNWLVKETWSPYIAGALTGLLMISSVWVAGRDCGASTTCVRSAGMIEKVFSAERIGKMEYFVKEVPKINWQWMFVVGILIGSFIASRASGTFQWKALPDMWESRFGPNRAKRALAAFTGGLIAMFGARLADG